MLRNCLKIDKWETPATKYPLARLGNVDIRRIMERSGYYRMHGVRGYEFYYHNKPIPITILRIGLETVMVDDPLHWSGMSDLAKYCKGKVLIGGLGLGLILWGLQENKEVTEIHVIENNYDVITLMENNIPTDKRIKIIKDDFVDYIEKIGLETFEKVIDKDNSGKNMQRWIEENKIKGDYNSVIVDIWWGNASPEIGRNMFVIKTKINAFMPNAKVMIWGHRNPEINPAVTKILY